MGVSFIIGLSRFCGNDQCLIARGYIMKFSKIAKAALVTSSAVAFAATAASSVSADDHKKAKKENE